MTRVHPSVRPAHPYSAWEDPFEEEQAVDVCCFGSKKQTPKIPSNLIDMFYFRESFKVMNSNDLINTWHQYCSLSSQKFSTYEKFIAWKNDLKREDISRDIFMKLFPEIIGRGLTIPGNPSQNFKAFLDHRSVLLELFQQIINSHESNAMARCFLAAKSSCQAFEAEDYFEKSFMSLLSTQPLAITNISSFFEQMRNVGQDKPELLRLHSLFPSNLPLWTQAWISIERDKIISPPPPKKTDPPRARSHEKPRVPPRQYRRSRPIEPIRPEPKDLLAEYQNMLRRANVPRGDWQTMHGFRLASLYYHPDKNPGHEEEFKQLAQLAEALEIK